MSNDPEQSQEAPSEQPLYEYATTDGRPLAYDQPPYVTGEQPLAAYPPQPSKKTHKRLWLILGLVGVVLVVLTCGSCIAASFFGFRFIQQNVGPVLVATQYYEALREQKYDLAYTYLDATATLQGQPASLDTITRLGRTVEAREGKITGFTVARFTEAGNTATIDMRIARTRQTYTAILRCKKEGNDWKIINANKI